MRKTTAILFGATAAFSLSAHADVTYTEQAKLHEIAVAPSAERIENDIAKLVSFGTRHTLSDTESDTHGIGAG